MRSPYPVYREVFMRHYFLDLGLVKYAFYRFVLRVAQRVCYGNSGMTCDDLEEFARNPLQMAYDAL